MTNENEQEHHPTTAQQHPSSGPVAPSISSNRFSCPHCGAYTHQLWYKVRGVRLNEKTHPWMPAPDALSTLQQETGTSQEDISKLEELIKNIESRKVFFEGKYENPTSLAAENVHLSRCIACDDIAVWVHERLVSPPLRTGPEPNRDLPPEINADYQEARSILELSPRGAAALLRLCVEKLCNHLNAEGDNLDQKIAYLVKQGLREGVQEALDVVRVIGNEVVHPGQMDLKDDVRTATALFGFVNIIADRMISEPKRLKEIYGLLPPAKLEAISRRDKPSKPKP